MTNFTTNNEDRAPFPGGNTISIEELRAEINELKVTGIEIYEFEEDETFSADITINEEFTIQRGTDGCYSIEGSHVVAIEGKEDEQDYAGDRYNAEDLAGLLALDEKLAEERSRA